MFKYIKIIFISLILFLFIDYFFGKNILKLIKKSSNINSSVAIKDDYQFYIFKNNENKKLIWGHQQYNFCTNEIGLKTSCIKKYEIKKKYKYAFIGDSFTEGIGVEYDKTFVGLFNRDNDTLNLGISGHSPYLYLKRLKFYNQEILFDNLILFLDLTDFEDDYGWYTRGANYFDYQNYNLTKEKYKEFLSKNFSLTFIFLKTLWWKFYLPNTKLEKVFLYNDKKWSWDYLEEKKIENFNLKKEIYLQNLINIINYCNKNNIKLYFVIYPHPGSLIYMKDISISKQNNILKSLCRGRNCKVINLYKDFYEEKTKKSLESTVNNYYIKYDIHFNEMGHKYIYDILKKKFDR